MCKSIQAWCNPVNLCQIHKYQLVLLHDNQLSQQYITVQWLSPRCFSPESLWMKFNTHTLYIHNDLSLFFWVGGMAAFVLACFHKLETTEKVRSFLQDWFRPLRREVRIVLWLFLHAVPKLCCVLVSVWFYFYRKNNLKAQKVEKKVKEEMLLQEKGMQSKTVSLYLWSSMLHLMYSVG